MAELLLWFLAPAALGAFLLFSVLAIRAARRRSWNRADGMSLALVVACVAGIFLAIPPRFRILSDETSLLGIAWGLLATGKASSCQEWVLASSSLRPLCESPPFRPVLFPLLIAITAFFAGARVNLPFVLDFVFFCALLFFTGKRLPRRAWAAVLVIGLHPVLLEMATSGGYDLLALLFSAVALAAWADSQMDLALAAALCFASTRYEGLALLPLLGFVLWRRRPGWRSGLPLLLASPLVLQRLEFPHHVEVPEGTEFFSVSRIPGNFRLFLASFFWNLNGPFPVVAHWIGLGAIAVRARGRRLWLPALFLVSYLLLLLGFHAGEISSPLQTRLYISFSVLLCFFAVSEAVRPRRWFLALLLVGTSGALFVGNIHRLKGLDQPVAVELAELRPFVEASPPDTLFVHVAPWMVSALRRACVHPWRYVQDTAQVEAGAENVVWIESIPIVNPRVPRPAWIDSNHLLGIRRPSSLLGLWIYAKNPDARMREIAKQFLLAP